MVPRPRGCPAGVGDLAAPAWGSLAGSRKAGWREMRFVNFARSEGKLARNSSVNFKSSDPTYHLQKAGWNGIGRGRTLKNGPPRSNTASASRAGRSSGPGAGRILKYTLLFLASFLPSFRPCSVPAGPRSAGRRHVAIERGRGRKGALTSCGSTRRGNPASPRPYGLMERADRGLATASAMGTHGWNGGVWHRFITPAEAWTGQAEAGGFEPTIHLE
jgi:hypothetical protein